MTYGIIANPGDQYGKETTKAYPQKSAFFHDRGSPPYEIFEDGILLWISCQELQNTLKEYHFVHYMLLSSIRISVIQIIIVTEHFHHKDIPGRVIGFRMDKMVSK